MKIQTYINIVEKQANVQVKKMRSDNGLEFCNSSLDEHLNDHGIVHELTQVEGPWQNPAERDNRTVVEKTRAIVSEASFPPLL